jgi:hypothetical protein
MIKKLFNELFGDVDLEKMVNEISEAIENEGEKDSSYFYKVEDKYDNGHHVSHIEKEVKDGNVIKDINRTMNIEDKNEKTKEDVQYKRDYKDKCIEYESVIKKLEKELYEKDDLIHTLRERCSKLMEENDKIKFVLRDLVK